MRKVVLVAALLVHAALLLAWRPQMAGRPGDVALETAVYLLAPPPKAVAPDRIAPAPKPRPATRAAPAAPVRAPALAEPAAITLEQPADAVAAPAEQSGAALLENARKLAGSVDRQLRKEKEARELVVKPEVDLTERLREIHNDYSEVPSHVRMHGGDRLDRVEGPHGTYCVRTAGNGPGGGRDPFKDSGKQVVVNCPQRGPLSDDFVRRKKKSGH